MSAEFTGRWVLRGGIRVPIIIEEPAPKNLCRVCGNVTPLDVCRPCRDSSRKREHGSHTGYNQHKRRFEKPCDACRVAEKAYQGKRYKRGQLSERDRAWCEKAAVIGSWRLDQALNRR